MIDGSSTIITEEERLPLWMTVKQVGDEMQLSRSQLYNMIDAELIPVRRVGKSIRIHRDYVLGPRTETKGDTDYQKGTKRTKTWGRVRCPSCKCDEASVTSAWMRKDRDERVRRRKCPRCHNEFRTIEKHETND